MTPLSAESAVISSMWKWMVAVRSGDGLTDGWRLPMWTCGTRPCCDAILWCPKTGILVVSILCKSKNIILKVKFKVKEQKVKIVKNQAQPFHFVERSPSTKSNNKYYDLNRTQRWRYISLIRVFNKNTDENHSIFIHLYSKEELFDHM